MKIYRYISALSLATAAALAGPREDLEHNRNVQGVAIGLLRQHKPAEAVAHLSANVRALNPGASGQASTGQALINIAFVLKNRRESAAAVLAANQALSLIASLPVGRSRDPERADLYYNAGLLCERVLLEPARGQQYYQAALRVDPDNKIVKERIELLERRKAPGRS